MPTYYDDEKTFLKTRNIATNGLINGTHTIGTSHDSMPLSYTVQAVRQCHQETTSSRIIVTDAFPIIATDSVRLNRRGEKKGEKTKQSEQTCKCGVHSRVLLSVITSCLRWVTIHSFQPRNPRTSISHYPIGIPTKTVTTKQLF